MCCYQLQFIIAPFWFQGVITTEDEKKALCTEDYSDISPLTGGNVAFSTLEGRPSAYNFDRSKVLQVSHIFKILLLLDNDRNVNKPKCNINKKIYDQYS